jgi:hypothetical protein
MKSGYVSVKEGLKEDKYHGQGRLPKISMVGHRP